MEEEKRGPGRPSSGQLKKNETVVAYRIFISEEHNHDLREVAKLKGSNASLELRDALLSRTPDEICKLAEQPGLAKDKNIVLPEKQKHVLMGFRLIEEAKARLDEAEALMKANLTNPVVRSMKSKAALIVRLLIGEIIKAKPKAVTKFVSKKIVKENPDVDDTYDPRGPWIAESLVQKEINRRHKYIYAIVNPTTGQTYPAPLPTTENPFQMGWIYAEENMKKKIAGKTHKPSDKHISDIYFPAEGLPVLKRFPVSAFTFRIRKFYKKDVEILEYIEKMAQKADVTKSDIYRQAIYNYKGSIPSLDDTAQVQICMRLKDEDKEFIEKMPLVRLHHFTIAEVLRNAIYEEIERYLNKKQP